MRLSLLQNHTRQFARSAAILVMGSLAAGCSSSSMRFSDGLDGVFTGSTANQREIIGGNSQPYPGDSTAVASVAAAPTSPVTSSALAPVAANGAVGRNALPPVSSTPVASSAAAPALAPVSTARVESPAAPAPSTHTQVALAPVADESRPAAKPGRVASVAPATGGGWSGSGTEITAKPGETVFNLSRRYGVPADAIMKANGLSETRGLQAGQKVVIPAYAYSDKAPVSAPDSNPKVAAAKAIVPADKAPLPSGAPQDKVAVLPQSPKVKEHAVASAGQGTADTGPAAKPAAQAMAATTDTEEAPVSAYTPPRKADRVIEEAREDVALAAPDSTGIGRMRWPVRGRVISGFGSGAGRSNDGIDIQVPEGTPVKAAENGVVIYAGDGLKEFGNTVLVRHESGLVTVYGHASEIKVSRGEKVKRGQEIALSGMSGTTDAPKLHFEVRKNSAPVDPTTFLE